MSLINDALKKVEEQTGGASGNPHNPSQNPNAPDPLEGNRKLFFILLTAGTLLIALIILLLVSIGGSRTGKPVPSKTTPSILSISTPASIEAEEAIAESMEQSTAPENPDSNTARDEDLAMLEEEESKSEEAKEGTSETRDINEDMFESFIGVASKMINRKAGVEEEAVATESDNADDTPSTVQPITKAQENLEIIMREAQMLAASKKEKVITVEDQINDFIADLNITGVVFSKNGNKVLVNNQVFTLGAEISPKHSLKISEIHPHAVVFTDESGKQYTKEF